MKNQKKIVHIFFPSSFMNFKVFLMNQAPKKLWPSLEAGPEKDDPPQMGAQKIAGLPQNLPALSPPLPLNNDRSLKREKENH